MSLAPNCGSICRLKVFCACAYDPVINSAKLIRRPFADFLPDLFVIHFVIYDKISRRRSMLLAFGSSPLNIRVVISYWLVTLWWCEHARLRWWSLPTSRWMITLAVSMMTTISGFHNLPVLVKCIVCCIPCIQGCRFCTSCILKSRSATCFQTWSQSSSKTLHFQTWPLSSPKVQCVFGLDGSQVRKCREFSDLITIKFESPMCFRTWWQPSP